MTDDLTPPVLPPLSFVVGLLRSTVQPLVPSSLTLTNTCTPPCSAVQVKSADRTLSYEEFVIIAKKFPTILFPPNVQLNEDEDNINPITGKKMLPPLSPVGLK